MEKEMVFMDRGQILSYEEFARFVRILAPLGITKVRVTGGEPLVRKGLAALIRYLAAIDGLTDIAMTTNGLLLKQHAAELKAAGLRRVNVSLDSLNPLKYKEITRRDALEQVLEGIAEAERVGLRPVKINVVAIRGFTDGEVLEFARFARERDAEVRFIEFMPLDAEDAWERQKILPGKEIIDAIGARYPLEPLNNSRAEPAALYRFKDGAGGRIGVITSGTGPFCQHCNRIRLTSDGKLRTCLFSVQETDIRALLRGGVSDEGIAARVAEAVRGKEQGHRMNCPDFVRPERTMHLIGG
jgi:cyclic pyranopterin phosphate synthase